MSRGGQRPGDVGKHKGSGPARAHGGLSLLALARPSPLASAFSYVAGRRFFFALMTPDSLPPFTPAGLRALFHRWKYLLGLALLLSAGASAFWAWSLPNVYSSTAVFLPTSPQSTDPDRLVEGVIKLELGARPEDLDRMLTIGQSLPLAEQIIRRFNLYNHYQAGAPGSDQVENYVLGEFSSNFSIVHNERDAIELTFQDRDKQLAAAVANSLVAAIDSVNQQLTLENRRTVLGLFRQRSAQLGSSYERIRRQLLGVRRRYGVFGLEMQGRYLAKTVLETEKELRVAEGGGPGSVPGLRRALRGLTRIDGGNAINLEGWTQGTDSVTLLSSRLTDLQTRLVSSQGAQEQAEIALRSRVSSLYLIQKAYPATRRSKPNRGLLVLSAVLGTLAIAVLAILVIEVYKRERN